MTDLSALIARVEEGSGPVKRMAGELADWADALFGENWKASQADMLAEALNGSLDAVLSLIEEKLPGWAWGVYSSTHDAMHPSHGFLEDPRSELIAFGGSNPARALLAATLRAIPTKETGHDA